MFEKAPNGMQGDSALTLEFLIQAQFVEGEAFSFRCLIDLQVAAVNLDDKDKNGNQNVEIELNLQPTTQFFSYLI